MPMTRKVLGEVPALEDFLAVNPKTNAPTLPTSKPLDEWGWQYRLAKY